MAYSGGVLSGSTSGRPISISATSTPGTLIHSAGATGYDEVLMWAANVSGAWATLTVEFGGTGTADHLLKSFRIPPNSFPIRVADGQRLAGGLSVRAFSDVAGAINITGGVNKSR